MLATSDSGALYSTKRRTDPTYLLASGLALKMINDKSWPQQIETLWKLHGSLQFCALISMEPIPHIELTVKRSDVSTPPKTPLHGNSYWKDSATAFEAVEIQIGRCLLRLYKTPGSWRAAASQYHGWGRNTSWWWSTSSHRMTSLFVRAPKTKTPDMMLFEEHKGSIVSFIPDSCAMAGIIGSEAAEILTLAEFISAQSADADDHSAFATAWNPHTRFNRDSDTVWGWCNFSGGAS